MSRVWWVWISLITMLMLAGCADQSYTPTAETIQYVGFVDLENVYGYIGITVKGDRFTAFVCDDDGDGNWIRGTINDDGTFELAEDEFAYFTARIRQNGVRGTFSPTSTWPMGFVADKATANAGLYQIVETVDDIELITGWVVLSNGEFRGCTWNGHIHTRWTDAEVHTDAKLVEPDIDP